ncbi:MAG: hypothetical protein IPI35_26865 [Deltaproteobacteria bacterium]|nr:hypothetical protein [Deltaproteobacteria bacterium]
MTWESDLDGLLDESFAAADGAILFETTALSPGEHNVTLTVTDGDGLYVVGTVLISVNDLPARHGEPEPVEPRHRRHVDGLGHRPPAPTPRATRSPTPTPGPKTARRRPTPRRRCPRRRRQKESSGRSRSPPMTAGAPGTGTASVTIQNTAPTLTSVSLTPTAPSETDTLTCTPSGAADADGDSVSLRVRLDGERRADLDDDEHLGLKLLAEGATRSPAR